MNYNYSYYIHYDFCLDANCHWLSVHELKENSLPLGVLVPYIIKNE